MYTHDINGRGHFNYVKTLPSLQGLPPLVRKNTRISKHTKHIFMHVDSEGKGRKRKKERERERERRGEAKAKVPVPPSPVLGSEFYRAGRVLP